MRCFLWGRETLNAVGRPNILHKSGNFLQEKYGLQIVSAGGPTETDLEDNLVAAADFSPVRTAGKTSLKDLAELIAGCRILVSNERAPCILPPLRAGRPFARPSTLGTSVDSIRIRLKLPPKSAAFFRRKLMLGPNITPTFGQHFMPGEGTARPTFHRQESGREIERILDCLTIRS